jgi:hypothetical protein
MIDARVNMLPVRRTMQRRLIAACVGAALSLFPLTAAAAGGAEVDALWNQPQGVSVDSAFYVVQAWWDGLTRGAQSDPTQRGFAELAQANADLLNAYTLLQQQRSGAGPQPVAIIDPLLSSVYNFITGSNAKAPVGSLFNWANQSLLKLEGRGTTNEIVRALLKDYQSKQAAAEGDLHLTAGSDLNALWTANAARETAFLQKVKGVTTEADGLAGSLKDADQSTTALLAAHEGNGQGNGNGLANGKSTNNPGKGQGSTPPGQSKTKP